VQLRNRASRLVILPSRAGSSKRLELEIHRNGLASRKRGLLASCPPARARRGASHGRFRDALFEPQIPAAAFPFDKIKIDRSFVKRARDPAMDSAAIVRAVAELGRSLAMEPPRRKGSRPRPAGPSQARRLPPKCRDIFSAGRAPPANLASLISSSKKNSARDGSSPGRHAGARERY